MELLLPNGQVISVAQLGPDFLILARPMNVEACVGEMVMRVDGVEDRWKVRLPKGARVDETRVAIAGV